MNPEGTGPDTIWTRMDMAPFCQRVKTQKRHGNSGKHPKKLE
jgi:hypothetical protein